ncbi:MAG: OsmC family protein [Gemmatimonadota bacterium]
MAGAATQTATPPALNGVDVAQLTDTIAAIEKDPGLARFQFQAHTVWEGGGRSRTRIQSFEHAGNRDESRALPFVLAGDEPPVLLGENTAPNAVETVLHALTSCLSVGFIYNAAARGIEVRSLDFDVEGDLDLRGFLGLDENVRPGYNQVRVSYRVDADAPPETLEELCEYTQRTSPVMDLLRNPVEVSVSMS